MPCDLAHSGPPGNRFRSSLGLPESLSAHAVTHSFPFRPILAYVESVSSCQDIGAFAQILFAPRACLLENGRMGLCLLSVFTIPLLVKRVQSRPTLSPTHGGRSTVPNRTARDDTSPPSIDAMGASEGQYTSITVATVEEIY